MNRAPTGALLHLTYFREPLTLVPVPRPGVVAVTGERAL